jgi:hypothetical protein
MGLAMQVLKELAMHVLKLAQNEVYEPYERDHLDPQVLEAEVVQVPSSSSSSLDAEAEAEVVAQVPFSSLEAEVEASAHSSETKVVPELAELVEVLVVVSLAHLIAPVTEPIYQRYHRPFIQK